MANNLGKQFEAKFESQWKESFPNNTCIDRIYDTQGRFKGVSNICDYICYNKPIIYYIDCKSHEGASFPFSDFTQYEKMKLKVGLDGVRSGIVLWLIDKNRVIYLPTSTITTILESGIKSFNPEKADKMGWKYYELPTTFPRKYPKTDYSVMVNLLDGE